MVFTRGPVGAGVSLTLVNLYLAIVAFVSIVTVALIRIHEVRTLPVGRARVGCTFVDVGLARVSSVPCGARASE